MWGLFFVGFRDRSVAVPAYLDAIRNSMLKSIGGRSVLAFFQVKNMLETVGDRGKMKTIGA